MHVGWPAVPTAMRLPPSMRRPDGTVVKTAARRGHGRLARSAIAAVSLLLFVVVTAAVLSDSAVVAAIDAQTRERSRSI